jgi:hypothetical protein
MHTIRLAGPWLVPGAARRPLPEHRRQLPLCAVTDGDGGFIPLVLVRRFHRPTGLSETSAVWLRLDVASAGDVRVRLNGEPVACSSREAGLGGQERWMFRLSGELVGFNEAEVTVESAAVESAAVVSAMQPALLAAAIVITEG